MQRSWIFHILLVETQNGAITLENSLAVSYTIKHTLTIQPCNLLLGIYPGEIKTNDHTKTCTQMFLGALFIISLIGNNINVLQKVNG